MEYDHLTPQIKNKIEKLCPLDLIKNNDTIYTLMV